MAVFSKQPTRSDLNPVSLDASTIDQIVQGVLNQISTADARCADDEIVPPSESDNGRNRDLIRITDRIVTAAAIEDLADGAGSVEVPRNAIITPAARDAIRERGLSVHTALNADHADAGESRQATRDAMLHACIVRHTPELDRVLDETPVEIRRELLGCPDDAAANAISVICRGDAERALIFAEQTHRAACLANRNENIKAAAVDDAADVRNVKQQLRVNVWCVDPTDRSWFELRNLLTAILE